MIKIIYAISTLLFCAHTYAAPGKIQDADVKSLAQLTAAGATATSLINTAKIYDTTYAGQLSLLISKSGISGITAAANGTVLTSNGSGQGSWIAALTNPMTTVGDLIVGGTNGGPTRLAAATVGAVLTSTGTAAAPVWQPNVNLRYTNNSQQSIPNNSGPLITNWTLVRDQTGSFNPTTGIFTAPSTGWYQINARLGSSGWTAGGDCVTAISTGTTSNNPISLGSRFGNSSTGFCYSNINDQLYLTSGSQINIYHFQGSGSAKTLTSGTIDNYLSIYKVGVN